MHVRIARPLLCTVATLFLSTPSFAQVAASITIAPPELPAYEQPACPGDGYIWTPGYWAWDGDYYWVPGTWVMPPHVGFLWTPGYWGWGGGGFAFNEGYWGASVGFYGGVNYGYGYFGHGYEGGRWDGGHFFYNTTLNNVNTRVFHNVYDTRVNAPAIRHVSYHGGSGGLDARATSQEDAAGRGQHASRVDVQNQHAWTARNAPQQRFSTNHGAPPIVATPRPSVAVHPEELPPLEHAAPRSTGNATQDQTLRAQHESLMAKQNQARQNLQHKQDREHQQLVSRKADPAQTQHLEQQHQQQTQRLQQSHTQQVQRLQPKQPSQGGGGSHTGGNPHR